MNCVAESLRHDIARHARVTEMMTEMIRRRVEGEPLLKVWRLNERIKNRWGGQTPTAWLAEARADISSAWGH